MRAIARIPLAGLILAFGCSGNDSPTGPTTPAKTSPPTASPAPAPTTPQGNKHGRIYFATAAAGGMSISTDKDDYAPGDTVKLTGTGWTPGDTLDIRLTDDSLRQHDWAVEVDAAGQFHDSTYVVAVGDIGVTFTLTATNRATGQSLTVQFTDAELVTAELTGTVNDVTVTQGLSANFSISLSATGALKCTATAATPATAKVNTVFSISAGGTVSSSTLSGAFAFFSDGISIGGPNCSVTWTGASTPYTQAASVSAAPTTPVGDYSITLSAAAGSVVLTNPGGAGGSLGDVTVTTIIVHVVAPANASPNAPTSLAQFKSNGTTSIPTGGPTNETTVVLKGTVSDPDAGNTVKLQVEVKPVSTAFTNTVTAESGLLASGSTAPVTVTGLVNGQSYHWQARAVDNNGAASAWGSFGGNGEAAADFRVDTDPPTVTINQAAGQADPTNASPINFTVVFSEDVSDFATGDVTLSGTASATTAVVTGSGTTYNVAVSGMTGDGTVIATVAAGVASDAAGNLNLASTSTDNTVTYDTTPPAISNFTVNPNPVAVNTPFVISATFTDVLSNVTGAEYSLDGAAWIPLGAVAAPYGDSKTESGTITISLPAADVLNVCVRSTDQAGNTNQPAAATNPIQCIFLAVYDPTAGFVTGGGWIDSPAGAYVADPSLTGKATFGFVSKYLKGANTPTGNTEFQFHAANLNFSSTAYQWLVVSGNRAQYKGTGTVNGQGAYGFLLTAIDGNPDAFRIKIWDAVTTLIIYDNQLGASDTGNTATALGGGSIMIQAPKK